MEWCLWWSGGGAGAGGGQEWWWSGGGGGGGGGVCCCSSSSSSWWWSPKEVEPPAATALHRPAPLLRRSIFVRCLYPCLYWLGYARPAPLARLSKVQDLPSPPFLSCPPLYRPAYLIVPCTSVCIPKLNQSNTEPAHEMICVFSCLYISQLHSASAWRSQTGRPLSLKAGFSVSKERFFFLRIVHV